MSDEVDKFPFEWQADDRVLKEIDRRIGRPPRGTAWLRLLGADAKPPSWLDKEDLISGVFPQQARIVRDGAVRWAHVVQANNQIRLPGPEDHGAQVVYAPDGDVPLRELGEIAHRAFELKGTTPADADELKLANMLTDEMERALDWPVPKSLTGGRQVITTIVILPREQMPGGFLAMNSFPVFADPATKMARLVPARFWPEQMRADWLALANVIAQEMHQVQRKPKREEGPHSEVAFERAVELTPAAAARVRDMLAAQGIKYGRLYVRVVDRGGGRVHDLVFTNAKVDPAQQFTYESQAVPIVIDQVQVAWLRGTRIDFRDTGGVGGFVFERVNAGQK